jgi:hypothetical protein
MQAVADNELALHWTAPAECPSQADVLDRAREIAGRRARLRQPIHAEVVVSRGDTDWRADIQLEGSTRTVQGESCSAVGEAVALIVALAVEHEHAESSPPLAPPSNEPERPIPSSPSTPSDKSRFFLGATLGVGAGTLPSADIGPGIVAGWRLGAFGLGVSFGVTAKVDGRTAERPEEGASFWLARGGLHACYTFFESAVRLGPCAGFEVGRIAAEGFGSPQPKSTSVLVPTASAGVVVLVRISSALFLRATLDGMAPLSRPSFSVEGTGRVHEVAAVGIRGAAGVEVHF